MRDAGSSLFNWIVVNLRNLLARVDRFVSRSTQHAARSTGLALVIVAFLSACTNGDVATVSPIPTATQPTATATAAQSPDSAAGATGTGVATPIPAETTTATVTATRPPDPTPQLPVGEPPVYGYRIVNSYPHDPEAFTQGLDFDGGFLYEGTGLEGRSSLRRVELETGKVLQQLDLSDEYFGEGVVVFGDRIYQLTWRSQVAFVYDRESFELIETLAYPTEGWGLTTDGERLIMSDGSNVLYFRDPETFAEIRRVEVFNGDEPVEELNELEWVAGEVWANIWGADQIVRIDPATGTVLGWIDLTGLLQPEDLGNLTVNVLNGIAYDEATGRIFVTGKLWPALYEIELVAP